MASKPSVRAGLPNFNDPRFWKSARGARWAFAAGLGIAGTVAVALFGGSR